MDVQLARQYHRKLQELYREIEQQASAEKRKATAERMHNIATPLYMVHSGAAQHIEEALRELGRPQEPAVNAARATIRTYLDILERTIESHPEKHFVLFGSERVFAKPVVGDELRSAIERGRLFHEDHTPFVHAFVVQPEVERMFLEADMQTLRPVLERLGFRDAEAILFFRTKAVPSLVAPLEQIPSLHIAKLRAGIPVSAIKHRVF